MLRLIFLTVLWSFCLQVFGQDTNNLKYNKTSGDYYIKPVKTQETVKKVFFMSKPLGLLNPILPNATAGLLLRINTRSYVEIQGGYIFNLQNNDYTIYQKKIIKGFKVNSEYKKLVDDKLYWGLQLMYNQYYIKKSQFYERFGGTYQQLFDIKENYNTLVFHVKGGHLLFVNNPWKYVIDIYGGLGLRYKYCSIYPKLPPDAIRRVKDGLLFENLPGAYLLPSAIVGIGIGF
ncbi:MAG: hypothetical protein IT238_04120 [Bacteroidia bacterium]|nr:hypothetical protein [Bacteroidia bacterium]